LVGLDKAGEVGFAKPIRQRPQGNRVKRIVTKG
jgi:hypothetical protein